MPARTAGVPAPGDTERDFYAQLGSRLRRARGTAISQRELADSVGLTRGSIANIEAGRQGLSAYLLIRVAEALGMSPAELLPAPVTSDVQTSGDVDVRGLDAGERRFVLSVASRLPPRASDGPSGS